MKNAKEKACKSKKKDNNDLKEGDQGKTIITLYCSSVAA